MFLQQGYEGYPPMTQQPMGQQYYDQPMQPMMPMGNPGFAPPVQAEDGEYGSRYRYGLANVNLDQLHGDLLLSNLFF